MRAVAAILVAAYHVWFGRVSGGVDVFIVISGFLITTSLLRQVDATGRVNFLAFWSGLARRLLPAVTVVLLAVTLASIAWLPRTRWFATMGDVVASGLYVENWLLAFRSVDYLARSASTSPLQHFWALSVQGQMYVLWPVVIAFVAAAAVRLRLPFSRLAPWAFAAVFAVSLAYSVVTTAANQPFAYFNTFARAWEFAMGGLLAIMLPSVRLGAPSRFVAGWVGLLGIVLCGAVLQGARVFPGYAALWPAGAAVLIMVAGTSGSRFGADRVLSLRPLTALGDSSYALYLWHWPVLVFYRLLSERGALSVVEGIAIILVSTGLAVATTRIVEHPIRFPSARGGRRRSALAVAGVASLVALVAGWGSYAAHARASEGRIIPPGDARYPGAAVMLSEEVSPADASDLPVHPGPLGVLAARPAAMQEDCLQRLEKSEPIRCVFGDSAAERVLAVIGSSYAAQWVPALNLLGEAGAWKIVTFTKAGCRFSADIRMVSGEPDLTCRAWNEQVVEEVLHLRPAVVFTNATYGWGAGERVSPGSVEQWRRLEDAGIAVVAIRNTPRFPFNAADCVFRHDSDADACALEWREAEDVTLLDSLEAELPEVHFVDLTPYFCRDGHCPAVIGNVLVYWDNSHLTRHFARTLAPMLGDELHELTDDVHEDERAPLRPPVRD